ncbi:AraC family transcriptional regulator [Amycolatopsis sp. cg5]|uniref:helix-turn-helix transcriptional regulator n=1 Tax=Amycolatopsis sp. cg5 TaxID=3238802 RepID=UPI0035251A08
MDTTGYVVRRVSTMDVAEADRQEFWRDHVGRLHCELEHRFGADRGFGAWTAIQRGGGYQLVEFRSDAVGYVRSSRMTARDPNEELRVIVPLHGSVRVELDGMCQTVGVGGAGVVGAHRPFGLAHDDGLRALIFTAPELPRGTPGVLDLTGGLGAVLGANLRRVAAERERLDRGQFRLLCRQLTELVQALTEPAEGSLVERAFRDHVGRCADDPKLTGEGAALALGWSLRRVQAALQAAGTTPSEVIRDQRLANAHARLRNPANRGRGVAEIAFASGFSSTSAFAEAFRRRYGETPSQTRG